MKLVISYLNVLRTVDESDLHVSISQHPGTGMQGRLTLHMAIGSSQ